MSATTFTVPSIDEATEALTIVRGSARLLTPQYRCIARFVLGTPGKQEDAVKALKGSRSQILKALAAYRYALTAVNGDHSALDGDSVLVGAFVGYYNDGLRREALIALAAKVKADKSKRTPLTVLDALAAPMVEALNAEQSHGETDAETGANGGNGDEHSGTGDTSGAGDTGERSPLDAINSAVRAVQGQAKPTPGEIALLMSATEALTEAIQALAARA